MERDKGIKVGDRVSWLDRASGERLAGEVKRVHSRHARVYGDDRKWRFVAYQNARKV